MYKINRPWFSEREVVSGQTFMTVTNAVLVNATNDTPPLLMITNDTDVSFTQTSQKPVGAVGGVRSLLVVRGVSGSGSPQQSTSQLANDFFQDSVNMVTQFKACSGEKLTFVPATGYPEIVDGVMEVKISDNITDVLANQAHPLFLEAAESIVGNLDQWTHVAIGEIA